MSALLANLRRRKSTLADRVAAKLAKGERVWCALVGQVGYVESVAGWTMVIKPARAGRRGKTRLGGVIPMEGAVLARRLGGGWSLRHSAKVWEKMCGAERWLAGKRKP